MKSTIAPAFILAGVMLIGGLSACAPSNTPEASESNAAKENPVSSAKPKADAVSSDAAKPDATAASPVSSSETKADTASSDAAKPDATAASPVSSSETKADTASSDAAKRDVVAANPTNSQKPKLSDAERAQKRKEVSEKLAKVLTPEQYKQLSAKLKSGEKMRKALTEINLTAEQKPKVKAILKEAYPRAAQNIQKSSETKPQ
jgi:Spy/CpxP family protein refolding chaperone